MGSVRCALSAAGESSRWLPARRRSEAADSDRIVRDERDAWGDQPGELQVVESDECDLVLQTEVSQG